MAVLKCPVCGGELEINEDITIGICKYCDATITIPKNLDRKSNLYNRAVFLRQNSEFDKAVEVYEDLLKEDNLDAEAHWGLVLSRYGIEYVLDPNTSERKPTCHRTQEESILSDPDYLEAIRCSDMEARRVIEEEAGKIQEIQSGILEISQKEPPYDIFICYKESGERGERTEDSILAQDLYYELEKRKYKVFFARKTLESKLGSEYEPVIFAALRSARVMIVLGTKAEHFNAVWVKNEWSRFLKMKREDHDKTVIPAYRGMSPYELPVELSSFQSQDMSKIGFMQDLLDGIERCMHRESKAKETAEREATPVLNSLERLVKNGQTYLKLDNYEFAQEAYETITRDYPEDYRGWWGLIVCATKDFTDITSDQTKLNTWFRYAKQLSDLRDFKELEDTYLNYIKKIAQSEAVEEIKRINATIYTDNNSIREVELQIAEENKKIEIRKQEFEHQESMYNNTIDQYRDNLKKAKSMQNSRELIAGIGQFIFSVVTIIIFFVAFARQSLLGVFISIVIAVCGRLIIAFGKEDSESIERDIMNQKNNIQEAEKNMNVHKEQYESNILEMQTNILNLEKRIAVIQEKIENCTKYINLGRNSISEFYFSKRCEEFGISQVYDTQIKMLREKALAGQSQFADE